MPTPLSGPRAGRHPGKSPMCADRVGCYPPGVSQDRPEPARPLSAVGEDYLAAIYLIAADHRRVIGARLAERLGVSRAAVAQTLPRLAEEGYLALGARSSPRLTRSGWAIAASVVRRRRVA